MEMSQFWRLETDVTLISKAEGTVSTASESDEAAPPPAEAWSGADSTEDFCEPTLETWLFEACNGAEFP